MVPVGAEIKDPQTGESLGRIETPCCEVVVDRVIPKMSDGHPENVRAPLDGVSARGLRLRSRRRHWAAPSRAQRDNGVDIRSGGTGKAYVEFSAAREGGSRKG
jgi:hypothetical protein